jgi:uroporphyrinogen decarboxylase
MADQMTHVERVRAVLAGKEPDRVPISMWRHFFGSETRPDTLAEAMLAFEQRFDWDFMKVNPRASYHVEGWGVKTRYDGDAHPVVIETPIKSPDDWLRLEVLPLDRGVLKEHLDSLKLVADGLGGRVPFIMTVFTPLAIAGRMTATEDMFVQHLREHTDKVEYALDVITETFTKFSVASMERGAWGLFYATTAFATSDRLTPEEYAKWGRPWDLELLNALPPAQFHLLHVCRERNFLPQMMDYPVHAFNWDARGEGNLSLSEARAWGGGKIVVGGIPHTAHLSEASPERLAGETSGIRIAMGKKGWMFGSGCTFPPETPESSLKAIKDAAITV